MPVRPVGSAPEAAEGMGERGERGRGDAGARRPRSVALVVSTRSAIVLIALAGALVVIRSLSGEVVDFAGFMTLAAASAWLAVWWAAGDAVPGRSRLLAWLANRPVEDAQVARGSRTTAQEAQAVGLLAPPGTSGELVRAVAKLGDRLAEWVGRHRRARHRAEQTERYESEFLTTVSHELRTPLNAILGFSQVLLDRIDGALDESQREDVETIRASGLHLQSLVDDVLDLARIESGLFTLELASIDVGSVVREVARLLEAQREGRDIAIESRVPADLPRVDADLKRVRQIVMNLGTNALKFTDQGSVVLEASASDNEVRIAVSDTGSGIRRDELAIIFEEFHQVQSVRRTTQGSGLGLAICKRLVDLHGGRIEVESTVGRGSRFMVCVPVSGIARTIADDRAAKERR